MFRRGRDKSAEIDEAEKPFWISYADLMTAAMTLFLIIMAVTIVNVGQDNTAEIKRVDVIQDCWRELKDNSSQIDEQVDVSLVGKDVIVVSFGDLVRFDNASWYITEDTQNFLRKFIPSVVKNMEAESCQKHFKRVMIEGYTSASGTYMSNLLLSNLRSQAVMCSLADSKVRDRTLIAIDDDTQSKIKQMFFTGGFSYSSQKATDAQSRRAELKIEFWKNKEKRAEINSNSYGSKTLGSCSSDFFDEKKARSR